MPKAVIFDMDGTLIDSIKVHALSAIEACREFKIEVSVNDYIKEVGKSFEEIIQSISERKGFSLSSKEIEYLNQIKKQKFQEHIKDVKLLPGVKKILSYLKSKGIKTALASSSAKEEVNTILDFFDLRKFFDVVVTKEDVNRAKPNPEIFLKAAKLLNIDPKDSIVIEDSDYGIIAAKDGGFTAFGVLTGKSSREELVRAGADMVFHNLVELLNYLKNIYKL